MSNIVDVVGIEGVTKFIAATKLTKFVIYRNGARSGATPIYDGTDCTTNQQVINGFNSWATNILAANPSNTNQYEMLLSDKRAEIELDEEEEGTTRGQPKGKLGKIKKARFSFCLANFNPYGGVNGGVNVTEAIKQALKERDQEDTLKHIVMELKSLKEQMNGEEEEEEEPAESMFDKAFKFMKEFNETNKAKNAGVKLAGDDILKDETETKKETNSSGMTKDEVELISKFAVKNPAMYKQYMATLRKMV